MPSDAPAIKVSNTKAYGAKVVLYDRETESREEIGQRIAAETGASLVKPYDDGHIIAGQGTVGLEIAAQAADAGAVIDALLSPCGGGGLISGTSLAMRERSAATDVYAVEPEEFDDTARSLAAGSHQSNDPAARSFCDALLAPTPGEITFAINRHTLTGGLVVSEAEIGRAMAAAFRFFKIVVEPGGAVALAAALAGKIDCKGRTIAVVCSGGNVDPETFQRILAET
jgi:threonine dehydratase